MPRTRKTTTTQPRDAQAYRHPAADLAARPEIGAQAHFKKAKAPATYRFDSSLAPELSWDGQNPAREQAESAIREIEEAVSGFKFPVSSKPLSPEEQRRLAKEFDTRHLTLDTAAKRLKAISRPFLNWTGKAERLSFDVPTLPLFVHERLSTKAILETLKGHKRDKQESFLDTLFASPERSLHDQVLRAYEHRDAWVNRLILGDSMVVMNSLLRFESLGGQVQTIYMDPPYGVKFGSNFQPFIRKRDVKHNEDDDFTREPEMVQAYRDTWELGLHSYLTYLRDRLFLARDLLAPSGSIFVQISDENLHHVREVMDEVFGAENFCAIIGFQKTGGASAKLVASTVDYLVWYAKGKDRVKFRPLFVGRAVGDTSLDRYDQLLLSDDKTRCLSLDEIAGRESITAGRRYQLTSLLSDGETNTPQEFEFEGKKYRPRAGTHWKTTVEGLKKLASEQRVEVMGSVIRYRRFADDFPVVPVTDRWESMQVGVGLIYVVQTAAQVIQRCLLMTTDPGDLVLDPTCGSGTTAYVAEQWGRRWITCDTSRVPLALARQRLLTATFDYYELKDEGRGPAGGFVYKRKQNQKGEEVGGIVPHIMLKSIANSEPPSEEVLVDRPEAMKSVVRVTGPFTFEATIPTAEGLDEEPETPGVQNADHQKHVDRMLEVLRRAPVLRLPGNQTVTLKNIRPPAKTLALNAEAMVDKPSLANLADNVSKQPALTRDADPVAILFGPENGPIGERFVREAWDEAGLKHYTRLYVIGFAIDPKARQFIDSAGQIGIPCTYLQATMDLQMGDLLKNMRSSQIFSVCGLPDVRVFEVSSVKCQEGKRTGKSGSTLDTRHSTLDTTSFQVELQGLDTFDPVTMEADHLKGADVPAWLLDTDYNGMVFRVRQAFFPRTGAWENLKKSLKVEFEDTVWDHLGGTTSAPFPAGDHSQIAVKVIDPRGNELLVVKKLEETE